MREALERALVAVARRLRRPAHMVLVRRRVRARLRRRAQRAWHATDAPLIVCYGAINRSAFAAGLARSQGRRGARAAGFYREEGRKSPQATIAGAARHGVDLTGHRSRRVRADELAQAPAIFIFDLENLARVAMRCPRALGRTHLLGALDEDPAVLIEDPHGRGDAVLEETLARIGRAVANAESGT